MAMLEAMAWELPVIVTPVGGIPEIVAHGRNGFLVNPGDIKQITKSMQTLIEDEPARLAMGRSSIQQASLLDVNNYCHSLFSLYCSVAESLNHPQHNDVAKSSKVIG
jgi:glycosyltransferase involved in cell wall biosynthesis